MTGGVQLAAIFMAVLAARSAYCAESALPREAEAVRKYLLESEYPELFQGRHYRIRIHDLVVADVDNDGRNDVVVHVTPHYRQSATVLLYRIDENFNVSRVTEGLAPGPLQPVTGEYLDSHTLGLAVDLSIAEKQSDLGARQAFVGVALKTFGSVVAYPKFFHVDSRAGNGAFIDMTQLVRPPDSNKCEAFEFTAVRQIAVGPLRGRNENYLAAWVGNEIYVYLINGAKSNGLLDKKVWVRETPQGFQGFESGKGLTYRTKLGSEEILDVETDRE